MRRALTFLTLAGATAMLAVSPVVGHEARTDSNVFITFAAGGKYKGKVLSPKAACERNRKVQVWHNSNPDFRIGRTTTENDGTWSLRGPRPPAGDEVYATMSRRLLKNNEEHRHVCKPDVSPGVTYPKN